MWMKFTYLMGRSSLAKFWIVKKSGSSSESPQRALQVGLSYLNNDVRVDILKSDWAVSLFRRVFALYENLPEEGGRRQTTGGKQEETVLKSIKSMLDVVCLHLSEPLFDLILKIVYDYATTNAKANSVRAFGQLVACLARVHPGKVLAKFMPFCVDRIEEELTHGASSVRTTSSHAASPSDTTLHWSKLPPLDDAAE
jgi:hypothetical protein